MAEAKDKIAKKMYRELALKFHPDAGGDADIFKQIDENFNEDIYEFALLYEELTGKTSGVFSEEFTEYKGKDFGQIYHGEGNRGYPLNQLGKTKYPPTMQGVADGWADVIIDTVGRIKWIENIVVESLMIKIYIDWVKTIKGNKYEQNAYLKGRFFDYESYADAVMEAVEGSIRELP